MTTIIKDETLTAIGDAIREKTGKTNKLTPAEMVTEIAGITTSGGEDPLGLMMTQKLDTYTNTDITDDLQVAINVRELHLPNCTQVPSNCFNGKAESMEKIILAGINDTSKDNINRQFGYCYALKKLPALGKTTYIGDENFYSCTSLVNDFYKLKRPLVKLGIGCFRQCTSFGSTCSKLFIDDTITTIDAVAFYRTNLTDIYTPFSERPSGWRGNAFEESVTIHYGVTEAEFDEILAAEGTV